MKNKVFVLLSVSLMYVCFNCFCQDKWNWVGENNDDKVIFFGVKNLNNKIYTFSSSINRSNSIPYVNTNLLQFDYSGNIIFDSVFGNLEETFVLYENVRSNYNFDNFCLPVGFRYPNNPSLGNKPGIILFDTLYNTKLSLVLPSDSSFYVNSVSFINKIEQNKIILIKKIQDETSNNKLVVSILDSTGQEFNSNIINFQNFAFGSASFLKNESNYYLICTKIYVNNINDPSNLVIFKMDTLLNIIDDYESTSNNWYFNNASTVLPNGDFIVGGVFSDGIGSDGDIWQKKYLRKFDKNLNILWTKYFGRRSQNTNITKIMITSDGNIAGCGTDGKINISVNGDTIGHITGCIFKFTADGDSIWMQNYQALNDTVYGDDNILLDLDEMPDGGFVACGKATAFIPLRKRGWLIRVDADGCIENCVSNTEELDKENQFLIYPNPSNELLNISNSNQISSYEIFQLDGKLINQGNYFPINISKFTNGIYFIKLFTKSKEIINQKVIKQ